MSEEESGILSRPTRGHGRASLKSVGERALVSEVIAQLARRRPADGADGAGRGSEPPLVVGPGDDAAAFLLPAGEACIVTTDSLVEGVHFERAWTTPTDLGYKLIQSAVSDIGAMGGHPLAAVVAISAPSAMLEHEFLDMTAGMVEAGDRHHLVVLGGDTTSSSMLVVTATILGSAAPQALRARSGARAGDRILVTGELGDAAAGLRVLAELKRLEPPPAPAAHGWLRAASPLADLDRRLAARHVVPRADSPEAHELAGAVRRFLRPIPPVAAGAAAAAAGATALIDISDGLASELHLIAEASQVGVILDESAVPIGAGARRLAISHGDDPLVLALHGGEDYELLMTVPADHVHAVTDALAALGVRLTEIGEVVLKESGLTIRVPGRPPRPLDHGGYEHFREAR